MTQTDAWDRARREQHAQEAKEFSKLVGGTDEDIKQWFFGLSAAERGPIIQAYGDAYGQLRREYAEEAFPHWRSGRRRMSGLVAKRLYSLLPPHMPISARLSLVESLWRHVAPTRVGTDQTPRPRPSKRPPTSGSLHMRRGTTFQLRCGGGSTGSPPSTPA